MSGSQRGPRAKMLSIQQKCAASMRDGVCWEKGFERAAVAGALLFIFTLVALVAGR